LVLGIGIFLGLVVALCYLLVKRQADDPQSRGRDSSPPSDYYSDTIP
jgi:hypothetical protein